MGAVQYSGAGVGTLGERLVNLSRSVCKAQSLDLSKGSCLEPPRDSLEGVAAVWTVREQAGTVIGLAAGYLNQ